MRIKSLCQGGDAKDVYEFFILAVLWLIPLFGFVSKSRFFKKGLRRSSTKFARIEQVVAVCVLGLAIVIGSTKEDVETPLGASPAESGLTSPTTQLPSGHNTPSFAPNAQNQTSNACLTAAQLAAGFALVEVRTNEIHDFSAPTNAIVYRPWQLRGAVDDGIYLVNSRQSVVNSDGTNTIQNSQSSTLNSQLLAEQAPWQFPVGMNVVEGLIVEANGRTQSLGYTSNTNLPRFSVFNCENGLAHIPNRSTFWYQYTECGSLKLTWQDVCFECNMNCPVSVQAEFYPKKSS